MLLLNLQGKYLFAVVIVERSELHEFHEDAREGERILPTTYVFVDIS